VAAREGASLVYDGHAGGFVGGEMKTDESGGRFQEVGSRTVISSLSHQKINITTRWNAVTLTAQHYLPRLSGTFCPTERAEPTVPFILPLTPTRTPRPKQNEGQGQGLQLMVVLACVVTAEEA